MSSQPQRQRPDDPATDDSDDCPYVEGPADPRRKPYATFETKPSVHGYTGGGYEHFRSTEHRPHTPGNRREDVYCSVHRLTAVVACYDVDEPLEDVLRDLDEKDVHHRSGVPWDNRPGNLEACSHGEHSSITQTQRRAWAKDQKNAAEQTEQQALTLKACDRCGTDTETLAECDAWPDGERRCIDCASDTADDDHPIRILT